MIMLQEAFDRLFKAAEYVMDADIEMSEEDVNDAMTELWNVLREVKKFYKGDLPKWMRS